MSDANWFAPPEDVYPEPEAALDHTAALEEAPWTAPGETSPFDAPIPALERPRMIEAKEVDVDEALARLTELQRQWFGEEPEAETPAPDLATAPMATETEAYEDEAYEDDAWEDEPWPEAPAVAAEPDWDEDPTLDAAEADAHLDAMEATWLADSPLPEVPPLDDAPALPPLEALPEADDAAWAEAPVADAAAQVTEDDDWSWGEAATAAEPAEALESAWFDETPAPTPAPILEPVDASEASWFDETPTSAPMVEAEPAPAPEATYLEAEPAPAAEAAFFEAEPAPAAETAFFEAEPALEAEADREEAWFDEAVADDEAPHPYEHHVVRARAASVGARAMSWLVDASLLFTTTGILLALAGRITGAAVGLRAVTHDPALLGLTLALLGAVGAIYTAVCTTAGGQTLGGQLSGIRILDGHGRTPTARHAALRALVAVPGALALMVGLVWVVLDDRGQALHDRISRTFVVEL